MCHKEKSNRSSSNHLVFSMNQKNMGYTPTSQQLINTNNQNTIEEHSRVVNSFLNALTLFLSGRW